MAVRLVIRGTVQGVGYRESMCREAARLGLRGWVRNRLDGSVEAVADGNALDIERLLQWARRGPPAARVAEVIEEPYNALDTAHQSFQRLPTL